MATVVCSTASTPVVTFINRRFEPLRGFHIFMRALPKLLGEIADLDVLLIGMDEPAATAGPRRRAPPGNR